MCNWTAYAGKKTAAPIVFEALQKTEGFWAGHYTGIASCDHGKLYLKKCCGHTGCFRKKFDLADLPGSMAIAHSRTPSGGLDNRAQPFLAHNGVVVLHSQGSVGVFTGERPRYKDVLWDLYADGYRPRSGGPAEHGMPELPLLVTPEGKQISAADVEGNAVERAYLKHGDVVRALQEAAAPLPGEHCSICLFADRPGLIGFINMNQRICYSFEEDGVYMATTMTGLPGIGMEIPGNSVGYVTSGGTLHLERLADNRIKTAVPQGLCKAAVEYLKEHPRTCMAHVCDNALRPLFNRGDLDYHAVAVYRAFESLHSEGIIFYEEEEIFNPDTNCPGKIFLWSVR